jgi:hypothetical protein
MSRSRSVIFLPPIKILATTGLVFSANLFLSCSIFTVYRCSVPNQTPFIVSEELHGFDGEGAKAANTPRIMLGMDFEPSLRFSSVV